MIELTAILSLRYGESQPGLQRLPGVSVQLVVNWSRWGGGGGGGGGGGRGHFQMPYGVAYVEEIPYTT